MTASGSEALSRAIDACAKRIGAIDHQFCGIGRRGGPHVGNEVRNREVHFVSNRRDDRHAARHDGPGQGLVVEGPQVFSGSAATSDDDHIDALDLFNRAESPNQILRGAVSLHSGVTQYDVGFRVPSRQQAQDGLRLTGMCAPPLDIGM